ncbi:hypothetical protein [Lysobacter sp. CA199]|uniref:hypothetical protein n=1 Tax=Lysobacter sp. CA199 TaxID=3455608 RepID=UPI003F8D7A65
MDDTQATFEVTQVVEPFPPGAIALHGHIRSGTVRAGLIVKISVNSQMDLVIPIKSVESVEGPDNERAVRLVLDVPEPELQALWSALFLPGDVVSIESPSAEPAPPRGTRLNRDR